MLLGIGLAGAGCFADASQFTNGKRGDASDWTVIDDGSADEPEATAGYDGAASDRRDDAKVGDDASSDATSRDAPADGPRDATGDVRDAVGDGAPDGSSPTCRPPTNGGCPGGTILCMECQNSAGDYITAWLDTNNCITNTDGVLSWQVNGHYGSTCTEQFQHLYSGGQYTNTVLNASCRRIDGSMNQSTLNISDGIVYRNGALHCKNGGA
jgi:hypothetical protein